MLYTVHYSNISMKYLIILTGVCLLISFFADWRKTTQGIRVGAKMFVNIMPAILVVLIMVSIVLYFIPNQLILDYLGTDAGFLSYLISAAMGSIALIPGFIAYPLAGILVKNGVGYPVVAIFITTLMMVGAITLPVEIRFFGYRVAIVRNILFLVAAIIIGLLMGLFY